MKCSETLTASSACLTLLVVLGCLYPSAENKELPSPVWEGRGCNRMVLFCASVCPSLDLWVCDSSGFLHTPGNSLDLKLCVHKSLVCESWPWSFSTLLIDNSCFSVSLFLTVKCCSGTSHVSSIPLQLRPAKPAWTETYSSPVYIVSSLFLLCH